MRRYYFARSSAALARSVFCVLALTLGSCVTNIAPRAPGVAPTVTATPTSPLDIGAFDTLTVDIASTRDGELSLYLSASQLRLIERRDIHTGTTASVALPATSLGTGSLALLAVVRTADGGVGKASLPVTVTNDVAVPVTVNNVVGAGLQLELTVGGTVLETLDVSATTSAFATHLLRDATYEVRVKTQPSEPRQVCALDRLGGSVAAPGVPALVVTCGARHPDDIPVILFTDLSFVPRGGAWLTLYGERFGASKPTVTVGGKAVSVVDATAYQNNAPHEAPSNARGLDKVIVQVGDDVPAGDQPIVLSAFGRSPSAASSVRVVDGGRVRFLGGPGAADGNDGTAAAPWATFGKLASELTAGDVVYVRTGSYSGAAATCGSGALESAVICLKPDFTGAPLADVGAGVIVEPGATVTLATTVATALVYIEAFGGPITLAGFDINPGTSGAGTRNVYVHSTQARIVGNRFALLSPVTNPVVPQLLVRGAASDVLIAGNWFGYNARHNNVSIGDPIYTPSGADEDLASVLVSYNEMMGSTSASDVGAAVGIKGNQGQTIGTVVVAGNAFHDHDKSIAIEECYSPCTATEFQAPIDEVYVDDNLFFPTLRASHTESLYFQARQVQTFVRHNSVMADPSDDNLVVHVERIGAGHVQIDNNFMLDWSNAIVDSTGGANVAASHNTWVGAASAVLSFDANEKRPASAQVVSATADPTPTATNNTNNVCDNAKTPTSGTHALGLDYKGRERDATPDRGAIERVSF